MKIIKAGAIPETPKPWWLNQVIECTFCKTEFVLEEHDKPQTGGERHEGGAQWVQTDCPTCGKVCLENRKVMRTQ